MRKPGRGALYYCSSEQGTPRGVERTTWLSRGFTGAIGTPFCHLKIRPAQRPSRDVLGYSSRRLLHCPCRRGPSCWCPHWLRLRALRPRCGYPRRNYRLKPYPSRHGRVLIAWPSSMSSCEKEWFSSDSPDSFSGSLCRRRREHPGSPFSPVLH